MIDPVAAQEFLALDRIALVGVSDDRRNFAATVFKELRSRGVDVVPVNPNTDTVQHQPCYPDLGSVPGEVDGVIVMVHQDKSAEIVADCAERGIGKVWLFQGLGGPGSVSDEALRLCDELGIDVIAGACPLMFLEPAGWIHRLHRRARQRNGSVAKVA